MFFICALLTFHNEYVRAPGFIFMHVFLHFPQWLDFSF
jgi:hypothetical protein